MAISFPLALPTVNVAREIDFAATSTVGVSISPFTREAQTYVHQGEWWEAQVRLPPMKRADAETWVAFLLALNGREGTFLMGDPVNTSPRGNGGGAPLVNGGSQTGKTLSTRGWTAAITGILLPGDWFSLGSGASTHLHKVVQSADSGVGSPDAGVASLEIWPRLRSAPSDGDALVIAGAKGLWRLASNRRDWSIGEAQIYGIAFTCEEAL